MTDAKQFSATLFLRHIVSRFSHLFSKSNCTLLLFVLRFEIRKKVIQIQVHFELNDQFKVHRGTVFENYRKSLILQWRAKRATFAFWVDKSSLKIPKNCQFWQVFENLNHVARQVTLGQDKKWWKLFWFFLLKFSIFKLFFPFFPLFFPSFYYYFFWKLFWI